MLNALKYYTMYAGTVVMVFLIPLSVAYLFNVMMYLINTL